MDIEFIDSSDFFSPLMKRYIALMVSFVCINITIIYEDLKLMGTSSQPMLTFKIFFIVLDIIILFYYSLNYSVVITFKVFEVKSKTKRIITIVVITGLLILFFTSVITSLTVFRPDCVRTLYVDIQCAQLLIIQLFIIVGPQFL